MKQKALVKALGLALTLAPFAVFSAVENVTYFGYAKWGNIYTDNNEHNDGKGERNDVIRAEAGYGNYRLGNELNWWEAGVKADIWRDGDAYFDTTLYLGSGDAWGDVSTIQLWSAGHGLIEGQENAKIWAGERFYRRHEVHMIDIKYWDTSNTGIGVEDYDVGFANAHVAWFAPSSNGGDERTLHHFDLRLSDIALSDSADLTLGFNYITEHNSTYDNSNITTSGSMFTASYRQGWDYGSNTFVFQYGTDGLAGGLMSAEGGSDRKYSTGEEHDGSSWRIFNSGDLNVNEDFQVMYSIAYQDKNLDNNEGEQWFSVGARPQYAWNNFMSTAVEIGYETVDAQNGAGTNDMFKATVAQLFQAGKGVWARPSFRIFATYSDSNTEWDRSGTTYGKAMHSGTGNVEEVTFGFNVETWW